jgi:hypothetical protein
MRTLLADDSRPRAILKARCSHSNSTAIAALRNRLLQASGLMQSARSPTHADVPCHQNGGDERGVPKLTASSVVDTED